MKLTELKPKWITTKARIMFDCPRCGSGRLYIAVAKIESEDRPWQMTGDSFDNLTLTPSIDFRHYSPALPASTDTLDTSNCRVHFFITKGEIKFV